jgi:hypothetical protein
MEKRFIPPATTFLVGAVAWLAFIVTGWTHALPSPLPLAVSALVAVTIFYSGLLCRRARGPRYGGPVRGLFLIVMAVLTFYRIDPAAGLVLGFGALATTLLVLAPPVATRAS